MVESQEIKQATQVQSTPKMALTTATYREVVMAAENPTKRSRSRENKNDWQQKSAAARIGVGLNEYLDRILLGQKWCGKCKDWHSRYIFTIDRSRYDGLASNCRNRKPRQRPPTAEQKQETRRRGYRAYYAGKGGAAIRERVHARQRNMQAVLPRHRESIMEVFDGLCAYCGEQATTLDHVVPVSKGGGSRRGNLLPACRSCNSRKRTKSLEQFLEECLKRGQGISDRIAEELVMEYVL